MSEAEWSQWKNTQADEHEEDEREVEIMVGRLDDYNNLQKKIEVSTSKLKTKLNLNTNTLAKLREVRDEQSEYEERNELIAEQLLGAKEMQEQLAGERSALMADMLLGGKSVKDKRLARARDILRAEKTPPEVTIVEEALCVLRVAGIDWNQVNPDVLDELMSPEVVKATKDAEKYREKYERARQELQSKGSGPSKEELREMQELQEAHSRITKDLESATKELGDAKGSLSAHQRESETRKQQDEQLIQNQIRKITSLDEQISERDNDISSKKREIDTLKKQCGTHQKVRKALDSSATNYLKLTKSFKIMENCRDEWADCAADFLGQLTISKNRINELQSKYQEAEKSLKTLELDIAEEERLKKSSEESLKTANKKNLYFDRGEGNLRIPIEGGRGTTWKSTEAEGSRRPSCFK
jgi:hypothetical protein